MKPEQHEKHFRGAWVPAELFKSVEDGRISTTAAWLGLMIDALVNIRGKDCWATNKWFAQRLGVQPRMIQYHLESLSCEGLLIKRTSKKTGQRLLRMIWSRLHPVQKIARGGCKKLHGDMQKIAPISSIIETGDGDEPHPGGGVKIRDWSNQSSDLLVEGISTHRKINRNAKLGTWPKQFKLLHSRDGFEVERIQRVAKWYAKQVWGQGDINAFNPDKVPVAICAAEFRAKFERIEMAMERLCAKRGENIPGKAKVRVAMVDMGPASKEQRRKWREDW